MVVEVLESFGWWGGVGWFGVVPYILVSLQSRLGVRSLELRVREFVWTSSGLSLDNSDKAISHFSFPFISRNSFDMCVF